MAAEGKTYRRVSPDIEEAGYIAGLVNADVSARLETLAKEGKHPEIRFILGVQEKWTDMHASLTDEAEAETPAPKTKPAATTPKAKQGGDAKPTATTT